MIFDILKYFEMGFGAFDLLLFLWAEFVEVYLLISCVFCLCNQIYIFFIVIFKDDGPVGVIGANGGRDGKPAR